MDGVIKVACLPGAKYCRRDGIKLRYRFLTFVHSC